MNHLLNCVFEGLVTVFDLVAHFVIKQRFSAFKKVLAHLLSSIQSEDGDQKARDRRHEPRPPRHLGHCQDPRGRPPYSLPGPKTSKNGESL
ncbi:Hypothetical protein FKW44_015591 [Caligus rogercresseyi]|uniref:Uncharacterized protein n=1 Tax=Caligus rogercresseyi TaxID=217165 RepID=A0A7T8K0R4_CALRO|nr:Hypothetical protein FKW44_015591 [Caligus rogercresseyi]